MENNNKTDLDRALGSLSSKVHRTYRKRTNKEQVKEKLETLFARVIHQESIEDLDPSILIEIRKLQSSL